MHIHMQIVCISNALYYFPALCNSAPDAGELKDPLFQFRDL
jgi:hypothetical protein